MPSCQDQIDALLKELAAATTRAEAAEKKLKAVTKERDDLKRQIESRRNEMDVRKLAERDASLLINGFLERIRELEGVDKFERDYLIDLLGSAFADKKEFDSWRYLVDYLYRKQSEATHRIFDSREKDSPAEPTKSEEPKAGTKSEESETDAKSEENQKTSAKPSIGTLYDIEQQQKNANGTIDNVARATRAVVEDGNVNTPKAVEAMSDIFDSDVPPQAEPKVLPEGAKKTAGRQVPESKKKALARRRAAEAERAAAAAAKGVAAQETEIEISYVCPRCGGTHWVKIKRTESHIRSLTEIIESSLHSDIYERDYYECTNCYFRHVENPEEEPIPVSPQGTLGQDLVAMAGVLAVKGVPVNRFERCVGTEEEQLGSDTLDQNINRLYHDGGLKVLEERIVEEAKKSEVIIVDETPFTCMQQAGKSQVDGEAVRKDLGTKAKQGQVVAVASAPEADCQFRVYYRSNSRSTDSIGRCLDGWTPDVIVADGLGVYDKLTDYKPKRRQVCVVHWRRKVLQALNVKELEDVVQSDDGFLVAQQKIVEGDPQFKMCAVVAALQKLYAWENTLQREPKESLSSFRRRVKACRAKHAVPLMESVDQLMKDMAELYVTYDETKKTYVQIIDSPLSTAIVFYMNNREGLRLFLSDPRIPPDSNTVEQAIRPVTIIRNDSHFKQSPEFLESMCGYLTLVETARLNGITKPMHWLLALGRAFYQHCLDWTLTLNADAGLNTTKPMNWDPRAVASFDVTRYLPWNWKEDSQVAD